MTELNDIPLNFRLDHSSLSEIEVIKLWRKVSMSEWKERDTIGDMWLPEKANDELVGKIIEQIEGSYGMQWIIETKEGNVRTPSHKVLQNRLNGIETGKEVKIIYDGEEPPSVKGQHPTKMYRVFEK